MLDFFALDFETATAAVPWAVCAVGLGEAVSYTHLDVYKRQKRHFAIGAPDGMWEWGNGAPFRLEGGGENG